MKAITRGMHGFRALRVCATPESRDVLLKFAGLGSASPAFMKTRYSRVGGLDDDCADDGTSPAGGDEQVGPEPIGGAPALPTTRNSGPEPPGGCVRSTGRSVGAEQGDCCWSGRCADAGPPALGVASARWGRSRCRATRDCCWPPTAWRGVDLDCGHDRGAERAVRALLWSVSMRRRTRTTWRRFLLAFRTTMRASSPLIPTARSTGVDRCEATGQRSSTGFLTSAHSCGVPWPMATPCGANGAGKERNRTERRLTWSG